MLNTDEIRKEVAVRHGLILDENDPALELVKINDIVLERCLETLQAQSVENVKTLTNAIQVGIADSKRTAGTVITDAADYVSEQAHTAVTSAVDEATKDILNSSIMVMQQANFAMKVSLAAAVFSTVVFAGLITIVAL